MSVDKIIRRHNRPEFLKTYILYTCLFMSFKLANEISGLNGW
jgi:hypothetical protein